MGAAARQESESQPQLHTPAMCPYLPAGCTSHRAGGATSAQPSPLHRRLLPAAPRSAHLQHHLAWSTSDMSIRLQLAMKRMDRVRRGGSTGTQRSGTRPPHRESRCGSARLSAGARTGPGLLEGVPPSASNAGSHRSRAVAPSLCPSSCILGFPTMTRVVPHIGWVQMTDGSGLGLTTLREMR